MSCEGAKLNISAPQYQILRRDWADLKISLVEPANPGCPCYQHVIYSDKIFGQVLSRLQLLNLSLRCRNTVWLC